MADMAIISDILVNGVRQGTPDNLKMAVMSEPTRLMATKKTKFEI